MSIKSDNWIRRMAGEHGMIEPFAPEQVRHVDGHKIVSYGTSSYGYDVRCASEFKIFTNINSTIVDPKHFDEKSFVDLIADVCVIPPNSFALARTVEYFRIPRNVLTMCLGKCVTGDTRVVDADTGAYVPITEMRWGKSTLADDNGRLRPARISAFVPQGKKAVYELRTRAGLKIRATANHPFLMLNGWVQLRDLRPGDRIAVARNIPVFGKTPLPDWEATLLGMMVSQGQCHAPGHGPTYTTADPTLVRVLYSAMAASGMGEVTYNGRCGYRLVNKAARGGHAVANRADGWLRKYGLNVAAGARFVPQCIFTAPQASVRLFLQALFSGHGGSYWPGGGACLEYCAHSRRLIEDVHHLLLRFGIFSLIREERTQVGTRRFKVQITDKDQIERFARRVGFVPDSIKQRRLEAEAPGVMGESARIRSHFGSLSERAGPRLDPAARVAGIAFDSPGMRASRAQSVPLGAAAHVLEATDGWHMEKPVGGPVWDAVAEIEPLGIEEVFDISVPALHNFVANDMIVHNSTYARCGIIVNVTPLEPEWEGHVTLEFSNTTPLPAKIYANEGVAQMLFFESDEVCATSYKDRGGKYQGQRGVTLPKT